MEDEDEDSPFVKHDRYARRYLYQCPLAVCHVFAKFDSVLL